jgi:hypothetical protein
MAKRQNLMDASIVEAGEKKIAATKEKTREQWLEQAVRAMDKSLLKPAGFAMPEAWKVTCGFPKGSNKFIGQCWPPERASDGKTTHMMVSPTLGADVLQVLGTLLHEMGHAAVGCEHKHKAPFVKFVKAVGLAGKPTATTVEAGSELATKLTALAERLGAYPHPALNAGGSKGKAGGGWVRLMSREDETYRLVISPKSLEEHGFPMDPWGSVMVPVK